VLMLLLPPNDFFVDARAEGEVLRPPPSCLMAPTWVGLFDVDLFLVFGFDSFCLCCTL